MVVLQGRKNFLGSLARPIWAGAGNFMLLRTRSTVGNCYDEACFSRIGVYWAHACSSSSHDKLDHLVSQRFGSILPLYVHYQLVQACHVQLTCSTPTSALVNWGYIGEVGYTNINIAEQGS